jgi:hypothetical protein
MKYRVFPNITEFDDLSQNALLSPYQDNNTSGVFVDKTHPRIRQGLVPNIHPSAFSAADMTFVSRVPRIDEVVLTYLPILLRAGHRIGTEH